MESIQLLGLVLILLGFLASVRLGMWIQNKIHEAALREQARQWREEISPSITPSEDNWPEAGSASVSFFGTRDPFGVKFDIDEYMKQQDTDTKIFIKKIREYK